jgi:hypothetical protein
MRSSGSQFRALWAAPRFAILEQEAAFKKLNAAVDELAKEALRNSKVTQDDSLLAAYFGARSCYVSAVSLWEIGTLMALGRVAQDRRLKNMGGMMSRGRRRPVIEHKPVSAGAEPSVSAEPGTSTEAEANKEPPPRPVVQDLLSLEERNARGSPRLSA